MRQFDQNTYLGMCAQSKGLVDGFGAQKTAASKTRVDHVSLSNYCNRNHDQMMPVDVMADLMKASGNLEFLDYLAGLFGKEVIDKPTGEAGQQAQKINSAIKEMAEAIAATSDDCDLEKKLKELREASQAIADLIASLEAGGA